MVFGAHFSMDSTDDQSYTEHAECGDLSRLLAELGRDLDQYLQFEHGDAGDRADDWQSELDQSLPINGVGIDEVVEDIGRVLIPNASAIPMPGCTSFITTGPVTAGVMALLAGTVASPQRVGVTAFHYLEELSLDWLVQLLALPAGMKGVYSSGGSVANLLALGAARQSAFEIIGADPAESGVNRNCRVYATDASHRTVHRAAAVLGLGRASVCIVDSDESGRMCPRALSRQLDEDLSTDILPVAVVANAGSTSTGVVDPLRKLGDICRSHDVWFHIDGAYGLPGVLDPEVRHLFDGLELADSAIIDPHKWLGAPVGISATFVRDRNLLNRAFRQGESDYLEGSFSSDHVQHSMDSMGIPYSDFGIELSAPARGAVVWALIREIGVCGLRERVRRHNAMARELASRAHLHPNLEVVQEPTLSICCFRYVSDKISDLDELNRKIHRTIVRRGRAIPSTAIVNGVFAIRPCFIGARTDWRQVDELIDEVLVAGDLLAAEC